MNLFEYLKYEDLNDGLKLVYNVLGIESVIKLINECAHETIYIPGKKTILYDAVIRSMQDFLKNGQSINLVEYKKELDCSYRHLQVILKKVIKNKKA